MIVGSYPSNLLHLRLPSKSIRTKASYHSKRQAFTLRTASQQSIHFPRCPNYITVRLLSTNSTICSQSMDNSRANCGTKSNFRFSAAKGRCFGSAHKLFLGSVGEGLFVRQEFMPQCMLEWVCLKRCYFMPLSVGCIAVDKEYDVFVLEEAVFLVVPHKFIEQQINLAIITISQKNLALNSSSHPPPSLLLIISKQMFYIYYWKIAMIYFKK